MYASIYIALLAAVPVFAAIAAEWRSRSIYQIMTDRFGRTDQSTSASCNLNNYCGGTWQGIIEKLDYIQDMGFTAIWISPVTAQLPQSTPDGTSYHGYWQQNINALNSNFGTASDLQALSAAVHARGMYLMVDVVVNHFAWYGSPSSVNYASFTPFNSQSYFHPYCPITQYDYSSDIPAVEQCWLGDTTVPLPDMNTTNPFVINTWNTWIKNLVSTYSIDGIRLDSAEEVQPSFWPGFNEAAGVYCIGEVYNGDPNFVCPYQNYLDGLLNYPLYFAMYNTFTSTSGSMSALANEVNQIKSACKDSTLLGTFIENHDVVRVPSVTSDMSLDSNAIAFSMLADGIPIVYEGQEQHFSGGSVPNNREAIWLSGYSTTSTMYRLVASINQVRNQAIYVSPDYLSYMAYPIYTDTSTIAMRKGFNGSQIVSVFSNRGALGASYTLTLGGTGYTAGQTVLEVLSCTTVKVDNQSNIAVAMSQGMPKIFYPLEPAIGSGISCDNQPCSILPGEFQSHYIPSNA